MMYVNKIYDRDSRNKKYFCGLMLSNTHFKSKAKTDGIFYEFLTKNYYIIKNSYTVDNCFTNNIFDILSKYKQNCQYDNNEIEKAFERFVKRISKYENKEHKLFNGENL